jgi:AcrR family transcriptional regulator
MMARLQADAAAARRTNDPVGERNRLVDAAALAFHRDGFAATSMHDVRRAAGATSGSLYHHFRTKKALVLAVITESVRPEVAATWIEAVRTSPNAATGILGVFEDVIAQLDGSASITGCPLNNLAVELSLADPDIRAALAMAYEAWRKAIADRLRADRVSKADFNLEDSGIDEFSYMVVAMFSGAMALAKAEQRTTAIRACANRLREMMKVDQI